VAVVLPDLGSLLTGFLSAPVRSSGPVWSGRGLQHKGKAGPPASRLAASTSDSACGPVVCGHCCCTIHCVVIYAALLYISVLILMQLGGCTWSGSQRGACQVEGGHYLPALGPARLRGEGCAQSLLGGAQAKHKRQQPQVVKREILLRHSDKPTS